MSSFSNRLGWSNFGQTWKQVTFEKGNGRRDVHLPPEEALLGFHKIFFSSFFILTCRVNKSGYHGGKIKILGMTILIIKNLSLLLISSCLHFSFKVKLLIKRKSFQSLKMMSFLQMAALRNKNK